jgi:hypothetical protein
MSKIDRLASPIFGNLPVAEPLSPNANLTLSELRNSVSGVPRRVCGNATKLDLLHRPRQPHLFRARPYQQPHWATTMVVEGSRGVLPYYYPPTRVVDFYLAY